MKILSFMLLIFLLYGCSKPKTVLICGDHICVNKTEAEQYFEKNLSLEVKILNNKEKKNQGLVELNLKSNEKGKKDKDYQMLVIFLIEHIYVLKLSSKF